MTLTDDMTRTAWLVRAAARDGVAPHQRLQAARDAAEEIPVTRPARLDPIPAPFDAHTRQRVATLRDVPTLHVARDPRDVIDDAPTCARTVGVEAYRRQVDSVALDPSHGLAQAEAMQAAKLRRAHDVAWETVRDIDGEALPATIARLVVEALRRDGVL